jgi:two-component system sporulation sensor kinase A
MDTRTLQTLTKDELVKIIEELQLKIDLQAKGISTDRVDYKHLVEEASDLVFVLDNHGHLVYHNAEWEALFGYKRGEALGMHFSAIVPTLELDRATGVFNSVTRGEMEIHNEKFKTYDKNNNPVYFIANLKPIRADDGKITGLFAILRNITEMHLMERKLKDNSRRLEEKVKEQIEQAEELKRVKALNDEIVMNSPIGILALDPTGIILSDNPVLKEILGHRPEESIVGKSLGDLKGLNTGELQKTVDAVFLQKRPRRIKNARYAPEGRQEDEKTLNLTINPILDAEKRVKSAMIMAEDVTEQAKIGSRMQRAEQLSAMGLLAAGVAYELKVPINLMTIDLNFIENNIGEDSPMRDYVKSMKDELSRMKQISEQLLNLSKPEERDKEVFEASRLVTHHSIQITLNRLQKNGYTVITSFPEESLKIRGIQNQLVQVLLHLIANAEEAMPDKGELRVAIGPFRHDSGNFAVVTVEDSGIGISQENLKKVFQPFFSTKGEKSTGLGLMVSYSIVENHGGTIGIKSRPGEGTSFRIILPAVEE